MHGWASSRIARLLLLQFSITPDSRIRLGPVGQRVDSFPDNLDWQRSRYKLLPVFASYVAPCQQRARKHPRFALFDLHLGNALYQRLGMERGSAGPPCVACALAESLKSFKGRPLVASEPCINAIGSRTLDIPSVVATSFNDRHCIIRG